MPFRSKSQERALFAKDPELALRWAAETPKNAKLPERVRPKKNRKAGRRKASGEGA